MPWVTDERGWNSDFVEKVGLGVNFYSFEIFADLAQIVVYTICASVSNAADRYGMAVVAGHSAMYVRLALSLVLYIASEYRTIRWGGGSDLSDRIE